MTDGSPVWRVPVSPHWSRQGYLKIFERIVKLMQKGWARHPLFRFGRGRGNTAGMRPPLPIPLTTLLLLALAGGCATLVHQPPKSQLAEPSRAVPVPLDPERADVDRVGALLFRGAVDLTNLAGVGGLSGLWVSADGARFAAIGDTGLSVNGRLIHSGDGRLTDVADVVARPLSVEVEGTESKWLLDAEEVMRLTEPDGGEGGREGGREGDWIVALERHHRLLRYNGDAPASAGRPVRVPTPPGVAKSMSEAGNQEIGNEETGSPENGGLESLTQLADGRLLTIEEGEEDSRRDPSQPRRAWVTARPGVPSQESDWLPFQYRSAPRFRPTGAAPLPDGGALVLERRVSLLGGWSTRIVRLPATALHQGADATGEELARLERPLLNDNFEGIATRPAPGGGTLLYILSDNNFSPIQRTYLALFLLP